jgi:hypothetical protein
MTGLMLFNGHNQKSFDQADDNPGFVHSEMQAEVSFSHSFRSIVPPCCHYSKTENRPHLDQHNRPENLNLSEVQIRYRTQEEVHLELKPGIEIRSGLVLPRSPGDDEPPLA